MASQQPWSSHWQLLWMVRLTFCAHTCKLCPQLFFAFPCPCDGTRQSTAVTSDCWSILHLLVELTPYDIYPVPKIVLRNYHVVRRIIYREFMDWPGQISHHRSHRGCSASQRTLHDLSRFVRMMEFVGTIIQDCAFSVYFLAENYLLFTTQIHTHCKLITLTESSTNYTCLLQP